MRDLRYAMRMLLRRPGYVATCILTLALGTGATTGIFSVANAVLLKPLPYDDEERIVRIWVDSPDTGKRRAGVSVVDFWALERMPHLFEAVGLYRPEDANLAQREPARVSGVAVSPKFLSVLGAQPARGRFFLPEEFKPGRNQVIILGHHLWTHKFGMKESVLGSNLILDGTVYIVVGIAHPGFSLPGLTFEYLSPLALDQLDEKRLRIPDKQIVAMLRSNLTLERVQSELNGLKVAGGSGREGSGLRAVLLREAYVGGTRSGILLLMASAGFLLLIACANLGNIALVHGVSRQKEFAIRTALGASRVAIVRQLLLESLVLAFGGGVAGLVLASLSVRLFRILAPAGIPRIQESHIDVWALLFASAISVSAALVFGLVPALLATKGDVRASLQGAGPPKLNFGSVGRLRLRTLLVTFEVAIALMLLVGSGLLIRSFDRFTSVDLGFDPSNLLTFWIALPNSPGPAPPNRGLFFRGIVERVESVAGVQRAGISLNGFFSGSSMTPFRLEDQLNDPFGETIEFRVVSAGFMEAVGIRLRRGRYFSDQEANGNLPVAIINEVMDQSGGKETGNLLNKHILILGRWRQIVGVVANVRDIFLREEPRPTVYVPYFSMPTTTAMLLIRTRSAPQMVQSTVLRRVYEANGGLPITSLQVVEQRLSEIVAEPRFRAAIITLFAGLGYLLSVLGVYGVTSYIVSQQQRGMAIRVVLGAQRRSIVCRLMAQGVLLTIIGLGTGLVACVFLTAGLSSLLYEIRPTDLPSLLGASLMLFVSTTTACFVPAWRATHIEPIYSLREE